MLYIIRVCYIWLYMADRNAASWRLKEGRRENGVGCGGRKGEKGIVLYINSVFNTASWKLKWGRSVLMGCVIYMMCFIYE